MENRWDLAKILASEEPTVRDFEGLVGKDAVDDVIELVKLAKNALDLNPMQCDILLNMFYEMLDDTDADAGNIEPELYEYAYIVREITSTRFWVMSGRQW